MGCGRRASSRQPEWSNIHAQERRDKDQDPKLAHLAPRCCHVHTSEACGIESLRLIVAEPRPTTFLSHSVHLPSSSMGTHHLDPRPPSSFNLSRMHSLGSIGTRWGKGACVHAIADTFSSLCNGQRTTYKTKLLFGSTGTEYRRSLPRQDIFSG